jgi:putative hemolysin
METIVVLDVEEEIAERDEGDNIFALMVPIPTPPPPCTPLPEEGAPPVPGAVSIANASLLAPLRISSRSVYSSDPSSYLQVEIDAAGNARIIKDVPGVFEEWYTIDGEVFAGEVPAEGLEPFQSVEEPETVAGFSDPMYLFAPSGETDRTTPAFPLHAVLWSGVDLAPARLPVRETLQGLAVEKLQVAVEPELVPESIRVTEDKVEDLRAAIKAGEGNEVVSVWVEPESGAIVKAEWNVIFADGEKALFTVDVAQTELKPVALPTEPALPNPASQHCVDQGYELQIREEVGGQVGYCVFPDGSECEEWAFYREECAVGENYP